MVREQEPARRPLTPSKANKQPTMSSQGQIQNPSNMTQQPAQKPTTIQQNLLDQPKFGQPTSLNASTSPFSRRQPLTQPTANSGAQRRAGERGSDPYANLFVSKSAQPRPELHKPHIVVNPLQQVRDLEQKKVQAYRDQHNYGAQQPRQPPMNTHQDDDLFEVPRPKIFSMPPKPASQPYFSSDSSTNPYFQPKAFVDLTTNNNGTATNRSIFDVDYARTDPNMYMDSAKANENIKALLEGALEDEDDQPRTRRRKKELQAKVDDLAEQLKGMNVKAEKEPEEEDEEEDDGTVEGLKVKLLPHQIDGVAWMRDKELGTKKTRGVLPKGGILADDMGLGKTIQSIALLLTNPKPSATEAAASRRILPADLDKSTLVVAPLALIKQWEGEIKDRVEESHALRVCVHHGPKRATSYKELRKYDVVITTYQTLSSEHAASEDGIKIGCFGVKWYRVILDEAHSIKNRNAKATKAACALNAEYRWCLSGTPMQNNLDELQSLIHFLQIKPYDDLNTWREQITKPMNNGRGGLAIKRLQVYLKAFMKRRTKDVLKQEGAAKKGKDGKTNAVKSNGFKIVNRSIEKVEADFTPEEREFYKRLESRTDESLERMMAGDKVSYASALCLLLRLRQACNHPKLIKGDLAQEKDAFIGSQTPSRKKAGNDDMDEMAAMLGGLSVETKTCDVCQIDLTKEEMQDGVIRCYTCEAELEDPLAMLKQKKDKKRKEKKSKHSEHIKRERQPMRRVVVDSDDEDEDVKPVGRKTKQVTNLVSSDVEPEPPSDSDEDIRPVTRREKQALKISSSDAEADEQLTSSSADDDDDGDEDSEESFDSSDSPSSDFITSTKIRHLLKLLSHDSRTHKYIVFSFFTSMLDLIEPFLQRSHISFVRYDGQMRNDAREASLASLRNDPSTRVLLCSLRAGSLGLNLTAASRVVILEPFWNPFVEEQAIDRVHRLNQTQDVVVYKMTIKDTVEARILELQEKKRELANATIEGKKGGLKLTLQDMLKLFRHDAETDARLDLIGMKDGRGLLEKGESVTHTGPVAVAVAPQPRSVPRTSAGAVGERKKEHEVYGRRW